jgi:hypothetical protein
MIHDTHFNHRLLSRPLREPVTGSMALTAAGTAASAFGTLAGGKASQQSGLFAQQAAEFRAQQEQMAAQESRASAQRSAFDKQRETRLLQSKLQARAAASGGGADDPTILGLAGDIAARGEYESFLDLFKGENRARGLEDSAMASRMSGLAARYEGDARRRAANLSAAGTIIGGLGSMHKTRYGLR